jgi:glucose-1-phosphate adenylyltransferase
VADGCVVEGSLSECVVGVRSNIGKGSKLEHTIMMGADYFESEESRARHQARGEPAIGVGSGCVIKRAIIDKNARVGNNVRLSPEGKPDMWQQGALFVRDGVIIVTKNGVVPDGTVV